MYNIENQRTEWVNGSVRFGSQCTTGAVGYHKDLRAGMNIIFFFIKKYKHHKEKWLEKKHIQTSLVAIVTQKCRGQKEKSKTGSPG